MTKQKTSCIIGLYADDNWFTLEKKMNKALQVKNALGKHISNQRAAKQFRLPPERVLASQFGYSRATIAKALGVLEGEGIIFRKKGSGTFIKDNSKERTMTIALAMRNAYHYPDVHFRLIVEEVSKYAGENNIKVQIFDHLSDIFKKDPDNNSLVASIRSGIIDGVLIISRMPISILNKISAVCPAVSINNIFGDGSEMPCVSCDYFHVGLLAGKYLLDKGHRKIAYITEDLSRPEAAFNLAGFKAIAKMNGVNISKKDVLETRLYLNKFRERTIDFFKVSDYTACFIRRSSHAYKIISILQNIGMKIPDDLSIISVGKYKDNQSHKLKLAIIDNKLREMSQIGLATLQKIINGEKVGKDICLLEPEIIENNSVMDINNEKRF